MGRHATRTIAINPGKNDGGRGIFVENFEKEIAVADDEGRTRVPMTRKGVLVDNHLKAVRSGRRTPVEGLEGKTPDDVAKLEKRSKKILHVALQQIVRAGMPVADDANRRAIVVANDGAGRPAALDGFEGFAQGRMGFDHGGRAGDFSGLRKTGGADWRQGDASGVEEPGGLPVGFTEAGGKSAGSGVGQTVHPRKDMRGDNRIRVGIAMPDNKMGARLTVVRRRRHTAEGETLRI